MAKKDPVDSRIAKRARELEQAEGLSPMIAEACAGIDEYVRASQAGESLEGIATVRVYEVAVRPTEYTPEQFKAARLKLKASQALFAEYLGVSSQTVSNYETGQRKVTATVGRLLDATLASPSIFKKLMKVKAL
ncbi:MAG: hypothetical protein ABS79_07100 [Planctomycetes bacterium SCN 63-9]|nr:MAG: hypothetical protein ABS79_07100 [Planctomycetes bacterium SCN 63-9]